MATGSIRLPADSTGFYVATRSKTEDAVTKHFERRVCEFPRTYTGSYEAGSAGGNLTVQATAHGATAGFLWLTNPVASGVLVALKRLELISQIAAATAFPTGPLFRAERMTFTGTLSAGTIAVSKRRTSDATAVAQVSTATTGLTPSAGAPFMGGFPVCPMSANAPRAPSPSFMPSDFSRDEEIILAAGEGLVVRQNDNGSTSDTRKLVINLAWCEFTDY